MCRERSSKTEPIPEQVGTAIADAVREPLSRPHSTEYHRLEPVRALGQVVEKTLLRVLVDEVHNLRLTFRP